MDKGRYCDKDIYNCEETGFKLNTTLKQRRVARKGAFKKSQTSLAANCHITVTATISTSDAPVPPFVIYPGQYLCDEWLNIRDSSAPLDRHDNPIGFL